jgi:hypothetical protein
MALLFRRFVAANLSDRIVQALQDRQHLRPHASIREALEAASAMTGFCTSASDEALAALRIDGATKVGRLTGCELSQLGRAIYRIWRPRPGLSAERANARDLSRHADDHSHNTR